MSDALFLLATAYRMVYAVAGCYLTARLAPEKPMQHALIGGAIGFSFWAHDERRPESWPKSEQSGPNETSY